MITPRAAGGNVQFCGHEEITLESEKAEVPDNLHHICKGESAAGESFEVLEIRTAVGKKVQFFHDVPIGAVGLATLLLYHNLQAGIVDGHDSVLVVIRYRQRSTALISAYEISPSASFE